MEHGGGPAWALALERSEFGQLIRESLWIYPSANVLHVLAIGLLLGSIVVFDLRVLGKGKGLAPDRLARLVLPVSIGALAVAAPTGFILFTAEATAYLRNPVFLTKMGLIVLALVNIAVMHGGAMRKVMHWGPAAPPPSARIAAGLSLALWLGVAASGRLIAYF